MSHASQRIAVILPALNEAEVIGDVLDAIPKVARAIVVDNGSTDETADRARAHGAHVLREPNRGYGSAVLCGLAYLASDPPDVVVVLDADHAERPELLPDLVQPIFDGRADCVFSDRSVIAEAASLTAPQRVGNLLATRIIHRWTGVTFRDLGPFRALSWHAVEVLNLQDQTWGFNVEMQLKAVERGLRILELPLPYRVRQGGHSKISGTISGTVRAGYKILLTLARHRPW